MLIKSYRVCMEKYLVIKRLLKRVALKKTSRKSENAVNDMIGTIV